ncbi:MAG: PorT family protein [Prevotellaceae bacterium]|jgi:hypothetical protein|nr:PorT family protein [Prevotellaceae bacterium]
MNNAKTILLIGLCSLTATSTTAQHFIGLSSGYAVNTLSTSIHEDIRSIHSWNNYGIIYKFYSRTPLWPEGAGAHVGTGLQSAINLTTRGYQRDSTAILRYRAIEIPFMTHLHISIWKFRLIGAAGLYVSYLLDGTQAELNPYVPTTIIISEEKYTFQPTDRRFDYGLRFGGGLALILHPLEIQFDIHYAIGLGYTHSPVIPGQFTVYNRFSQMILAINALIAL